MLELKKTRLWNMLLVGNLKGLLKNKLLPLHGTFLPNIKSFGCKIGIQLNNAYLGAEQTTTRLKL